MGFNGAKVFAGAIDQAQRSAQNLEAIRQARQKRQQEDEAFELNKKKANLELEEMRLKNSGTAVQQKMYEMQLKEYERQQKAIAQGKDAVLDQEEHKQTMQGKMAQTVARQVFNEDPQLQYELAQRLNPGLAQVPGPQGGMVQGRPEPTQTPEALPDTMKSIPDKVLALDGKGGFKEGDRNKYALDRIKALKAQGIPLTRLEEEVLFKSSHPDYDRNKVINRARQMAKDVAETQGSAGVRPEDVEAMIPKAEEMLYGETIPRKGQNPKGSITPLNGTIKDQIKAKSPDGRIKVISPSGQIGDIPEAQWEAAQAKGYKRAN